MKIKIQGYPKILIFETELKLPAFKYGCKIRTKIAQKELSKIDHGTFHDVEDFIVESVEKTKSGKTWHLGS